MIIHPIKEKGVIIYIVYERIRQKRHEPKASRKIYKECISYDSMVKKFNVIVEQGEDGYLISEVVELPGCHTQAKTYDELLKRTKEAIELYLDAKEPVETKTKFLSLQQIEV